MTKEKDPKVFLTHILESITLLEEYLYGVTEEQFHISPDKQDLAVRRIEVIGEAVKNIPETFKKNHPDIPWQDISDMRNVLIHEYFDIDYNIVWKTATQFIPPLKEQIQAFLKELSSEKK